MCPGSACVANNALMSPVSHGPIARWLLPKGVDPEAFLLLAARALRVIGDGYMALLLPVLAPESEDKPTIM
jgi:hypothetical protein